jgi:teichuronic acid biosynthesis glycosyltransferase TuaC
MKTALVLSHLFPTAPRPGSGPFVKDQVDFLVMRWPVEVIAPVRWVPPLPFNGWLNERSLAARTRDSHGYTVWHPRVAAFPHGGLRAESRLLPPRLLRLVQRIAKDCDLGLVHAHFGLPDGFAALALAPKLRVPSVVTFWGSDALVYSGSPPLRHLVSDVARAASWLVAVSGGVRDALISLGAQPARIILVPGGIPSSLRPVDHEVSRERLGIGVGERLLVWAGGLVPVKQPLLMIRAISRLADPKITLAMAGDGPLRSAVVRLVKELKLDGRVRLLGQLKRLDLITWQSAADLFVNSSASEGMPVAVSEALYCGTPVAAFHVGGIPELVGGLDGGTLAKRADAESLARAIEAELEFGRSREGLRNAAAALSLSETIRPLVDLYGALLDA